ncbi:hypothetical protein Poly30_36780 [Planctomycetes bacterium Poly30]|uniref:Uncharacterized protein n=1 Tax=Saltatorellus ferox TaxID=2528018 RepID=A0A518EVM1_9BACT|nr:hypothetical protein Poly30_36780 [Planctomycetes bacterium Poly30]
MNGAASADRVTRRRIRQRRAAFVVAAIVAPLAVLALYSCLPLVGVPWAEPFVDFYREHWLRLACYGLFANVASYPVAFWVLGGDDPSKLEDPASPGVLAWVSAGAATLSWVVLMALMLGIA